MPPSSSSPPSPVAHPRPVTRKTRVSSINIPSPDVELYHRDNARNNTLGSVWLSLNDNAPFGQTLPTMNTLHTSPSPSSASNSPTSALIPSFISSSPNDSATPTVCGMPLKYVSLFTLAIQNALLTIIMHYSRVSTPPSQAYSAAAAVLVNELLKGGISLAIALMRIDSEMSRTTFDANGVPHTPITKSKKLSNGGPIVLTNGSPFAISRVMYALSPARWHLRLRRLRREIFSQDCWKLSIPAILYVIQNNLQFVAASNLDVATFQVTYQMKILTTAAFSVMLLRRKLSATKWLALLFLALGVGIVQIQSGATKSHPTPPPSFATESVEGEGAIPNVGDLITAPTHTMRPMTGFMAVCAACLTSGLAGVYFEMVLKNSQADLWVRNVQLSLFSLIPAIVPIIFTAEAGYPGQGWLGRLFRNFTPWAWATVLTQVAGGLVTAIVIKHADNILKGFATSLSIIISFLASVLLFGFTITPAFVLGSSTVLGATWMYNQPPPKASADGSTISLLSAVSSDSRRPSFPGSPVSPDAPILGQMPKQRSPYASPSSLALALGITSSTTASRPTSGLPSPLERDYFGTSTGMPPLYSSPPSRPPSRPPSTKPPTRPPSRPPSARPSREGSRSGSGDELQNVDLGTGALDSQYRRPPPIDTSSHLLVPPPVLVEGSGETTKLIRR
ncbi:hypothetical protein DACRYDRAFT_113478 [Dacryopinax primogenitus]|uniref:Nucleotide-sugar transporter n=1 Tax=Dacryopinax primogenitus (strain DJM 731) TaxID=1858805 RepID=M5G982_DACPD|nr:uncharacterized protein DACRYDRAFT_113478 [Dacryopinax primogenitus]EJU05324.1 hypothetical protein DACRYDRAFT_113478 [Dacryopinax primogenitus]